MVSSPLPGTCMMRLNSRNAVCTPRTFFACSTINVGSCDGRWEIEFKLSWLMTIEASHARDQQGLHRSNARIRADMAPAGVTG